MLGAQIAVTVDDPTGRHPPGKLLRLDRQVTELLPDHPSEVRRGRRQGITVGADMA
jgi:hypothetical protein